MGAWRDLSRRRLRTGLTIVGITIGIWALVVFSALANRINALVAGGSDYYGDTVIVRDASERGVGIGLVPLDIAVGRDLAAIPGSSHAEPEVQLAMSDASGGLAMQEVIRGIGVASADIVSPQDVPLASGRHLETSDDLKRVTVVGADIARRTAAQVGATVDLRGSSFTVVGILLPALGSADSTAFVPLPAAQELFLSTLPARLRSLLDAGHVATQFVVHPSAGVSSKDLARRIEATVSDVSTMTSDDFDRQVGQSTAVFNAIIVGVALISLVVGGLSVINTMAMAVSERTREIGIKRAIGASRRRIVRDLVTEAGLIGLVGGGLGVALGTAVTVIANDLGRSSGTVLFDMTVQTGVFSLTFAVVLGMLAGLAPAWAAARLDPVTALRFQ